MNGIGSRPIIVTKQKLKSIFRVLASTAVLLAVGHAHASENSHGSEELDQAWTAFIQGLNDAKTSLEDPAYFPPEPSDRVLAEGYRYLLGHLNRAIEFELRAHPRFPEFFRSMDILRKWTGENPDAMYLKAPIDETGYYRVSGRAANSEEWRTSTRGVPGPKAPRLVTFQTITAVPGNTGKLEEMARCKAATLDFVNSFNLELDDQGRFEILIGPEKPKNHRGNFLLSRKTMTCQGTGEEFVARAKWLAVREIFSDWKNELPLDMEIVRLDAQGESRPPFTVEVISEKLSNIASEIPNQIRFWNQLMEFPLEMRSDRNGDGRRALPVNGINEPAPPFTAGGAAGAQQLYAAGIFELEDNEALVIKVSAPVEPHYIGFQLNNLWMEGPDQQNYVSSLTGNQLPPASDGARYYIIAHQDPGLQGWVDTTGLKKGFHAMRFVFRDNVEAEKLPRAEAFHIKLKEIKDIVPKDTPRVSSEERRQQIAVRQGHIKQRWRGH